MKEAYKPTKEEIDKAESTMTDKQEKLSVTRENYSKYLEDMGKSGQLEKIGRSYIGNIDGHKIEFKINDVNSYDTYVEGVKIDGEDGQRLKIKYLYYANRMVEGEDIAKSNAEIERYSEETQKVVDDLLK